MVISLFCMGEKDTRREHFFFFELLVFFFLFVGSDRDLGTSQRGRSFRAAVRVVCARIRILKCNGIGSDWLRYSFGREH